ncbi:MAG: histidine kinase dimerization/phospho-acceptor domain-containing protein [Pirellulaceae bacterium]
MRYSVKLIWKLLAINVLTVVIALLTVVVAIHLLAADYFVVLMNDYDVSPVAAHSMFLEAADRYVFVGAALGLLVSTGLSFWLTARQTTPISQVTRSAELIAQGDFSGRVEVGGCGEVQTLSRTFQDMSDRLRRSERLRKDFIVDVTHELRTPLTNLQGFLEGLRDGVISPDREVFEGLHEDALRLSRLVEELMTLSSADQAKSNLSLEKCDLKELVEHAVSRHRIRLEERSLTIALSLGDGAWIRADRNRLLQVLGNLLENACRYAVAGTLVEGGLTSIDGRVRLCLSNAVESAPSDPSTLFERFQRGEVSRSRAFGGAGLGLAIVKELVEAHGGRVGCEFSSQLASFWFELPLDN